jgi:hypothetical protein
MSETFYPWFWAVWALAGVIVEGAALYGKRHEQDTLSRNVQWIVLRGPAWKRITAALWVGFAVWFVPHIWM